MSTIPLFKITANNYYHLLIVGTPIGSANSTTMNYKIYVRGNLVASPSAKIAPARMLRRVAYLGRSTIASDSYFHGNVDLLRYYTYAVSAQHASVLSTLSGPTAEYVAPDAVLPSSTGAGGPTGPGASSSSGASAVTITSTGTSTPATSTGLDDRVNAVQLRSPMYIGHITYMYTN